VLGLIVLMYYLSLHRGLLRDVFILELQFDQRNDLWLVCMSSLEVVQFKHRRLALASLRINLLGILVLVVAATSSVKNNIVGLH